MGIVARKLRLLMLFFIKKWEKADLYLSKIFRQYYRGLFHLYTNLSGRKNKEKFAILLDIQSIFCEILPVLILLPEFSVNKGLEEIVSWLKIEFVSYFRKMSPGYIKIFKFHWLF